jgi:hypothetical protein
MFCVHMRTRFGLVSRPLDLHACFSSVLAAAAPSQQVLRVQTKPLCSAGNLQQVLRVRRLLEQQVAPAG